jgi:Transposase DDE domain
MPPIHHDKEVTVDQSTFRSTAGQADAIRNHLDQQTGLPFLELLSTTEVEWTCGDWNHQWRSRIYTPWITLCMFLSQILSSDHSCGDALERFQKYRKDCALPPVADNTASYCEARQRLPEEVVWDLARRSGRSIHDKADGQWLFQGRPVKLLDGSTVIMPDTEANQAEYPQSRSQKPGLGFPIARLLVVISLAVGTVLEAAMGPYQGKQSSELGLFRQIRGQLQRGDIALADRFFCNYWVIADSLRRGVDVVFRLHQTRKTDFRRGRRLGPDDHIVTWPKSQRPDWMSRAEYAAMPKELKLREIRVRIKDRTKRTRELVIVTTLLDATKYSASALGDLFRQRWHAELDLRTLKTTMGMEMLRTKTPDMVRKEVGMHLLAYNLIRGVTAEAARGRDVQPRELSFNGARQTIRAFEQTHLYEPKQIAADFPLLLDLIVQKRVGDRPDRYEPRAIKRRPKPYRLLMMARREAKRRIERGEIIYERIKH